MGRLPWAAGSTRSSSGSSSAETGLVVTPFLPGDSLLFAVGALAATDGSPISIVPVMLSSCSSPASSATRATTAIGYRIGPAALQEREARGS